MNITALRYFVQVAHSKSISKAAQELFITQPALSRLLQRLEAEIGVPLFERNRGKMICELTEAGKQCLYDAERILVHANKIVSTAQMFANGEQGTLTVGFGGLESEWFFDFIQRIRTVYSRIELKPIQMNWSELGRGIADKSIDLAFFLSGFHYPEEECFRYAPVIPSRLQVIVSRTHPLSNRKTVTIEELKEECFIGYENGVTPGYYEAFYHLCEKHGFSPKFIRTYGNSRMIWSDIYAGLGIGLYESCAQELDNKMFTQITVSMDADDPWPQTNLSVVYHRDNTDPCLQNVIRLIEQIAQRQEEK